MGTIFQVASQWWMVPPNDDEWHHDTLRNTVVGVRLTHKVGPATSYPFIHKAIYLGIVTSCKSGRGQSLQIMFLNFPSWWFFTNPLEQYAQVKMDIFPFRKEYHLNQPSIIVFDVHRNRGVFFSTKAPLQGSQILRAIGCTVLASQQEVTVKYPLSQMWSFRCSFSWNEPNDTAFQHLKKS